MTCRLHVGTKMLERTERIPFVTKVTRSERSPGKRTVYFCPLCSCVALGEEEYMPTPYQARQVRRGHSYLSQL
jgi:hypothetical protein